MYSSELTKTKRDCANYANYLLKKQMFDNGLSIRIEYQKGGIDYDYLNTMTQAIAITSCSEINLILGINENIITYLPVALVNRESIVTFNTEGYPVNSSGFVALLYFTNSSGSINIVDAGYRLTYNTTQSRYNLSLDDGYISIPTYNSVFNFFGTNYAATNGIYWCSNNILVFTNSNPTVIDSVITASTGQSNSNIKGKQEGAILLNNYDRRLRSIYTTYKVVPGNYSAITICVVFDDRYDDDPFTQANPIGNINNISSGKFQIRLVRQLSGNNIQWIEVKPISRAPTLGYMVGDVDSQGKSIDTNQLSPYNIYNNGTFLNPLGSSPPLINSGTSFVFQSDSTGSIWQFINNVELNI